MIDSEPSWFLNLYHAIGLCALLILGFYVGWRIRRERYKEELRREKNLSFNLGLYQGEGNSNAAYRRGYEDAYEDGVQDQWWWYMAYDEGYEDGVNDTRNETVSGSEAPE